MIVTEIKVQNFRNHAESALQFGEGINALLGDNGQGKTNILEAISYLGLTKSFYASSDQHTLRIGCDRFEINGTIVAEGGHASEIRIVFERGTSEKTYTINRVRPEKLSSVIGLFPVVVLSPESNAITFGGPAERRRFIDLILSEISPLYLSDLLEFRRALKQRNRILADGRFRNINPRGIIEPWNESLAAYGSRIIHRRGDFVCEFREYVKRAYRYLVDDEEEPEVSYLSSCGGDESGPVEVLADRLQHLLEEHADEEQRRGVTLVGPHRDELEITLDGISVQQYASQGQHKTLLVALKMAEFFYLRERKEQTPILLLDDVFSELDTHRAARILGFVADLNQSIVTTTDERAFQGSVKWNERHRRFHVEHGTVRQI